MPPDIRFQHHGAPAETREQWEARQAAEAAVTARMQAEALRAAEAARAEAEARRRHTEVPRTPAERGAPTSRRGRRIVAIFGLALAVAAVVAIDPLYLRPLSTADGVEPAEGKLDALPSSPVSRAQQAEAPRPKDRASEPDIWGGLTSSGRVWVDAPTVDPEPAGWWCICYKTDSGTDHTACRRNLAGCDLLREKIETGGSASIMQGSARTNSCVHVPGVFPWLRLGHREAWRPSSFTDMPGGSSADRDRRRATQASGVCVL